MVAVVSFAGGAGSRWTKGAGVVKALNPFCRLGGKHRSFIEVHLARSRRTGRQCGTPLPHVITTSYLTHDAIQAHLRAERNYDYPGPLLLSPGRSIGLRFVPMERDLRFAWEELPQQMLDEQAQKVRDSLRATLIAWARQMGEGASYTDNVPMQCLHPVGHWYEVPNMMRNGTLLRLFQERPRLKYLMVHNIDTTGTDVDPGLLGYHIAEGAALTTEVIARQVEDRGGGLARVDGRVRLVEGLALPSEEIESTLSWYNSATYWIDIDQLLTLFGLTRDDLTDIEKVNNAVRTLAARMPTYITLKDVKKRWGKGQEDVLPVAQFEKLWGDMTSLAGISLPLCGRAPQAWTTTQRTGAARRLAARWVGGFRRVLVRLGSLTPGLAHGPHFPRTQIAFCLGSKRRFPRKTALPAAALFLLNMLVGTRPIAIASRNMRLGGYEMQDSLMFAACACPDPPGSSNVGPSNRLLSESLAPEKLVMSLLSKRRWKGPMPNS